MSSRTISRFARLIGCCVVVAGLTACNVQNGIATRGDLKLNGSNQPSPPLAGDLVGGGHFDITKELGHPVVVDFWGTWCGPCRQEQPDINALRAQYAPRGVVFIGVAMLEAGTAEVSAYQRDLGVLYPSINDDGSLASDWDVSAPPTVVVVDAKGRVVNSYLGTVAGVGDVLQHLLAG